LSKTSSLDDEENDVEEKDRMLLQTGLEMTLTEFDLLQTLIRVFDHARSHFVYEICDPSIRRFLNAHRIRYEENAERMPWSEYKLTLLSRIQNSSTIDGLISFFNPQASREWLPHWLVGRGTHR
jgi:hypothetical protein